MQNTELCPQSSALGWKFLHVAVEVPYTLTQFKRKKNEFLTLGFFASYSNDEKLSRIPAFAKCFPTPPLSCIEGPSSSALMSLSVDCCCTSYRSDG